MLHVFLNDAKLAMESMVEILEGGLLQIMTVLPNVDFVLCVMEIQIQTGFRNVIDIVDLQEYRESKLAKIIAQRANEFV